MSGSQGTGVNQRSSATALTSNESITVLFPKIVKRHFPLKEKNLRRKQETFMGKELCRTICNGIKLRSTFS